MTAIVTSLERRLAKIEASRRPPRGLYFVVWGCTAAEIEEGVSRARETGHIADGELIVRCAWPAEYPMPAPRWAHDDMRAFSPTEFGALMGEVDRYHDDLLADCRAEMQHRSLPDPTDAEINAVDPRHEDKTRSMTDAVLIGIVLAVPLNGERASLTDDRMERLTRSITALGMRDRIRGRDDALFEATQRAGHVVRH
ncbi:hypothetical protein MKK88_01425 [Methylobacterium sp. E-005]|uniref:hypothetical protein n=1 Tax=Methylobacterium sp. E-005 TaxID=2836549 RepID=UPI001FB86C6F|nr:hypothetical protein [Methylobacterium sp. E-005]MCJ2084658.1 hypothetical protein [Methylobacterium sp. E-005]